MSDEHGVRIEFAKLHDGTEVDVEDALGLKSKGFRFYCVECSEELTFKNGIKRISHFSHHKSSDKKDCLLRIKERKIFTAQHPENVRKEKGEGRLLLRINNGRPGFYIKALWMESECIKENLSVKSGNSYFYINDYFFSEGECIVWVTETEKEYILFFDGVNIPEYFKKQHVRGISDGDIFIQNMDYAERIERPCIDIGDVLFVVGKHGQYELKSGLFLMKIEITDENIESIASTYDFGRKLANSFKVDIVLPVFANPWGKNILGNPGGKALLAVHSETQSSGFKLLDMSGNGKELRYENGYWFGIRDIPPEGKYDFFSIHRHLSYQEFKISPTRLNFNGYLGERFSFTIRKGNDEIRVLPGDSIEMDSKALDILDKILQPDFSSNIKINRRWISNEIKHPSSYKTIDGIMSEREFYKGMGANKLELSWRRLPNITISFVNIGSVLTMERIVEALNDMEMPRKINKTFLMELLQKMGVPGQIPGGFKKKVRKAREVINGQHRK